jgi:XTP/dITP diphosphohydrolase
MKILIATGNAHKADEIRAILSDMHGIEWLTTNDVEACLDPVEDAPDYEGNALIKARAWAAATGLPTVADDSGLEVDALGGRPGVHSARYAPTSPERIARLLAEMEGVPGGERGARFVCAAVLVLPTGEEHARRGVLEGRIATEARGEGGFGYDPVFVPDGEGGRHLAELPAASKDAISHRGRAFRALAEVLPGRFRFP